MIRVAAAVIFLAPISAFAQVESSPLPEDPLAGPTVAERASAQAAATLIKRDFEGRIRELESSLEEAATSIMELSDEERRAVESVFVARWAALDRVVRENLETLQKLDSYGKSGQKAESAPLLRELIDSARPMFKDGTLRDQVERALPPEKQREFRRLIDEYVRAAVSERIAQAEAEGKRLGRLEASIQLRLELLGKEVERSVYRVINSLTYVAEELIKKLELSPEQESEIRRLIQDFGFETGLKATEEEARELFVRIAARLKPEQLKKLMSEFRGQE